MGPIFKDGIKLLKKNNNNKDGELVLNKWVAPPLPPLFPEEFVAKPEININRDFPGGPMVKTPRFQRRGHTVTIIVIIMTYISRALSHQAKLFTNMSYLT